MIVNLSLALLDASEHRRQLTSEQFNLCEFLKNSADRMYQVSATFSTGSQNQPIYDN